MPVGASAAVVEGFGWAWQVGAEAVVGVLWPVRDADARSGTRANSPRACWGGRIAEMIGNQVRKVRRPSRSKAASSSVAQGQEASRRKMSRCPLDTRRPAACQAQ